MHMYDVIVLGVGGMGSAACDHIARRGLDVLGIEQFHLAHDRGSSHGDTRLIRKAYFEHPDYVPLLHDAYRLWRELELDAGRALFERVGLLMLGLPDGDVIRGVQAAAREHQLAFDALSAADVTRRFPGFRVPAEMVALFEHDAGLLRVEACVQAHAQRALLHGATILTGQAVHGWCVEGASATTTAGVRVQTAAGEFCARQLVITAGAWASRCIRECDALAEPNSAARAAAPALEHALRVQRMVQLWFTSDNPAHQAGAGCPAFCCQERDGFFYGFPGLSGEGAPSSASGDRHNTAAHDAGLLKIAEHSGGTPVDDPTHVDRELRPEDLPRVQRFIAEHLPGVRPLVERHSVCLYTMTPDQHFIIDRHPRFDNVFIAAGFSGHGFKFAPVVGSILADFVATGATRAPISFLSAQRPSLRLR